jgi:pimeloyl-ACP methyl ester carboxylesterase
VVTAPLVLIPGFWLNAESWDEVGSHLRERGWRVRALTLPGMASRESSRRGIGLADHVAAVVAAIDAVGEPVILVGHSAGGALAYAATDARPDAVRGVIYVDSMPLADGECVNADLADVAGEIPLPDWSAFGPEDLVDLDESMRNRFRTMAIPVPAAVARDPQRLRNPRRYTIPSLIIACEYTSGEIQTLMAEGHPWAAEAAKLSQLGFFDLVTGHWPQFTRPIELAAVIADTAAKWSS